MPVFRDKISSVKISSEDFISNQILSDLDVSVSE